jgi:DnaJ-class molecular chaperone
MRDVRRWGWFGDVVAEEPCARCDASGALRCPRCKGQRKLIYRSAAWR